MATIFYSMAGEGRGHAARARTLATHLSRRHQVRLFAPAAAYQFLSQCDWPENVRVSEIPGLLFAYKNNRVCPWRTIAGGGRYLAGFTKLRRQLIDEIHNESPDLVVTDFEPALPAAAERCNVPYLSIDHQHFLTTSDLSELPTRIRAKAFAMRLIIAAYYYRQVETVTSSFYFPPLRRALTNVTQIGVLLRDSILEAVPTTGEHVVVYLRRFANRSQLDAFAKLPFPVHIYGLGNRPDVGSVRFCETSDNGFVRDLASCRALISNAGNQLVGEALYLDKPVLAMPEDGNDEQSINAHFLRGSGGGDWCWPAELSADRILRFIEDGPWTLKFDRRQLDGTPTALARIAAHLPVHRAPRPDTSPSPASAAPVALR